MNVQRNRADDKVRTFVIIFLVVFCLHQFKGDVHAITLLRKALEISMEQQRAKIRDLSGATIMGWGSREGKVETLSAIFRQRLSDYSCRSFLSCILHHISSAPSRNGPLFGLSFESDRLVDPYKGLLVAW